jgi:hypothetical protein
MLKMTFNRIAKRVFIGGGPMDANDIQSLISAGIVAVVDCRELDDNQLVAGAERSEIEILHNPTADDGTPKPASWFEAGYNFAHLILQNKDGAAYFHCDAGRNRGPSMGYYFMRREYGLFGDDVKHIMHVHRPITDVGGIRYADDADAALRLIAG